MIRTTFQPNPAPLCSNFGNSLTATIIHSDLPSRAGTIAARSRFENTMMFPKRLFAFILLFALAIAHVGGLHAQWVQTNGPWGGSNGSIIVSGTNVFTYPDGDLGVFLSTDSGMNWSWSGLSGYYFDNLFGCGNHLFAKTSDGFYISTNNGVTWVEDSNLINISGDDAFVQDGSIIFAGGYGVQRSTDDGFSWAHVSTGLPNYQRISSLALIGTLLYALSNDSGVYRSTDSGITWTRYGYMRSINALAVSGAYLVIGTSSGVFRSSDSGTSWTFVTGQASNIQALVVGGTQLYAVTQNGDLLVSNDTGTSWKVISSGITKNSVSSVGIIGTIIFTGTDALGVCISTDSGKVWEQANKGLTYPYMFSLASIGDNVYAGTTHGGVYRSSDNGTTWSVMNSGLSGNDVRALTVSGTTMYAATQDGGVSRSTDSGKTWSSGSLGLFSNNIFALAVDGSVVYAGSRGRGVFRSTDSGESWTYASNGVTYLQVFSLATIGNTVFEGNDGGVFRSMDSGATWTQVNDGLTGGTIYALIVKDSNLFAGTDLGVFRLNVGDTTWVSASNGLNDETIVAFAISGSYLFASSYLGHVFISTDNGLTWLAENDGLANYRLWSLAVNGKFIFVSTEFGGVWRRPLSDFGISSVSRPPITARSEIHVYPNPFSGNTTISFTSESSGYADVSIVNALGAEVAHLYSGDLAAGEHSFTWSDPSVCNGMYECLVRMNGRVESVPVVLAR
jgi:photosystem II stability/assembly factor-like uncharacterized protein